MAGAERSGEIIGRSIDAAVAKGRQLTVTGDWAGAIVQLTPEVLETQLGLAKLLNVRGLAHRMNNVPNNYTMAEIDFRQARFQAQQSGDLREELESVVGLLDLARTARWGNDYPLGQPGREQEAIQQALTFRGEAVALIGRMPDGWNIEKVKAHNQFGLLSRELGDHRQAVADYSQAEVGTRVLLSEQPGVTDNQNVLARALHLKGLSQLELEQYGEAISAQEEARVIYQEQGDVRGLANTGIVIARVHLRTGDIAAARGGYEQAIKDMQRVGEAGEVVVLDPQMHEIATKELAALNPK